MKKQHLWLAVAVALAGSLAACSGDNGSSSKSTPVAPASKPTTPVAAAPAPAVVTEVTPATREALQNAITGVFPAGTTITEVNPFPVPGLVEFVVNGDVYYGTPDGAYIMQGNILSVASRNSLTDEKKTKMRAIGLREIKAEDAIVFGPKDAKYNVTVFTDVDCGYCRKMHDERDAYAAQGIALHYLPYPRSGASEATPNPTAHKLRQVWCSTDRGQALTESKQGQELTVEVTPACNEVISTYYALGGRIGVSGTPAVFSEKGTQLGGYVPAEELRKRLDAENGITPPAPTP